jgi:hydroxymethylbilane synthase
VGAGGAVTADRPRLRLGTRASPLALRQAGLIAAELERRGAAVEIVRIRTSGDVLAGSLAAEGGKGLFVKEIEEALLAGRIDLAVHSLKDVPAVLLPGLALVATPPREDARDVLVSARGTGLAGLARGARVGTSSLRRRAQLLARRPDVVTVALRGNVDTRLRKLAAGEVDALLLAAAGLHRLGLAPSGTVPLAPEEFLPAIGQGALAIEARAGDEPVLALLRALDDPPTAAAVAAERAFLAAVGGDCQTPLAAHATVTGERLRLRALVAEVDGSGALADELEGEVAAAAAVGARLAAMLLARGAADIIERARAVASAPVAP